MLREIQACPAMRRRAQFKVPSKSHPGQEYTVQVSILTGEVMCDCPGFRFRGTCIHTDLVEERCGWVEGDPAAEAQTVDQVQRGVCPRCGSATIRVGAPSPSPASGASEDDSEGALLARGVRVPAPPSEGR